jgi:DNA repair protein RadD
MMTSDSFEFYDRRPTDSHDRSRLRPLFPRQEIALEAIKDAIRRGKRRIIVQAACGFGKTQLAAHILTGAMEKGKRALFAAPAVQLVEQTILALEREGLADIGVIQAQHERTDHDAPLQIACVQSLIRRKDWLFDVGIFDEIHLNFNSLNARLNSDEWRGRIAIGLTATPGTKGLGLHWDELIVAGTAAEGIRDGWLCPFQGYEPPYVPDMSKARSVGGDYREDDAAAAMDTPKIVGDIVSTWLEKGRGRPTWGFAVNRAHAAHLQDAFQSSGVNCGYIDGFSDPDERRETFRRFRNGDDEIIMNVGVLVAGVDEPYVSCMIDAAPTKSKMKHVQRVGRFLRTHQSKEFALLLDHAGNNSRLGTVDMIEFGSLNCSKPGDKELAEAADAKPTAKPRRCSSCGFLLSPGMRVCSICGTARLPACDVVVEDGELVPFGGAKNGKKPKAEKFDKQQAYSELRGYALDYSKSDKWVLAQYRQLFGVWPRGLSEVSAPPSFELANWVRSRNIAYVKAKRKAEGVSR